MSTWTGNPAAAFSAQKYSGISVISSVSVKLDGMNTREKITDRIINRLSQGKDAVTKKRIQKAIRLGAGGVLLTQASAIAAVTAIDIRRKYRHPPKNSFPYCEPQHLRTPRGDITVYTYGAHLYQAQLKAIREAKHHIYFEIFIMKADKIGKAYRKALIAAAKRGVEVYIIIDTWGNLNQPPSFRHYPDLPHLHVIRFPLIRPGILTGNPRQKGRDHRKILCIDGNVGFVGGYNIGKIYEKQWRDTHIQLTGSQVWELENAFTDMWNMYRSHRRHPEIPDSGASYWNPEVRAAANTPAFNSYPVRGLYLESINRAAKRIWITMGYFIPDEGLRNSLKQAARRGVDVRILLPRYSNHIVADWVGRPYYTELLQSGVRIFWFKDAMVHAKTMTADGAWSTVGTTNIDRLSMSGNFEINLEIFSSEMASLMEEIFRVDLSNSVEVTLERWENRSRIAKLGERILRPLGPLL
ncbi:phospholipase D-like domain-containing protein [Arcanobacterium hippocoleae]